MLSMREPFNYHSQVTSPQHVFTSKDSVRTASVEPTSKYHPNVREETRGALGEGRTPDATHLSPLLLATAARVPPPHPQPLHPQI
uniref:Uncharacterized protein n=1 Tax=Timema bartmani TaxID=61472 RepID=A0A7R9EWK0_9NEOP|nr:unnamed protein product [Timema bartmani]